MAFRTSGSKVEGILMQDYDRENRPNLTPFIETANVLITRVVACAVRKDITLTAAEAELLERWVAAHAYVMSDQPYAEKWTQRAKAVYQGKTGMHLEASKYGQMAMSIDPSGCLAALSKRQRVSMSWLGKVPTEQTDYLDRR